MNWNFDPPEREGWYAITYCWDAQEGLHCGADYWNGITWRNEFPVVAIAGPFPDEKQAAKWADENDMEKP